MAEEYGYPSRVDRHLVDNRGYSPTAGGPASSEISDRELKGKGSTGRSFVIYIASLFQAKVTTEQIVVIHLGEWILVSGTGPS